MPDPTKKPTPTLTNHRTFDPWNTSSTGHQVSDSNPGTTWQRTREAKLAQQFRTGDCAINSFVYDSGKRVYERGEWEWDWGGDARGGRGGDGRSGKGGGGPGGNGIGTGGGSKQSDIRFMMRAGKGGGGVSEIGGVKGMAKGVGGPSQASISASTQASTSNEPATAITSASELILNQAPGAIGSPMPSSTNIPPKPTPNPPTGTESTILRNTTIYINGKTTPLISDHKLKQLLVAHGATLALGLSRRVTHIIIGKPNAGPGCGAGGVLAAGKIQKEVKRGGWRGIRIVGVEW
ncbi:hypothetical protein BDV12DRAFT_197994 [Aspergillus spectabilis]